MAVQPSTEEFRGLHDVYYSYNIVMAIKAVKSSGNYIYRLLWLRAGRPGDRGSIPGGAKDFFL
jgi:hypothetical protein